MTPPRAFIVTLRAARSLTPTDARSELQRLLKRCGRAGLRCVALRELENGEPDAGGPARDHQRPHTESVT